MTQYSGTLLETDSLKDSRVVINSMDEALKSNNSGITFPITDLVIGMDCYILDGGAIDPGKYTLTQLSPSKVWRKNIMGDPNKTGNPVDISDGGTGAITPSEARINLELGSVATQDIVPISMGGTGASNTTEAISNLGIDLNVSNTILQEADGGTGVSTVEDYLIKLSQVLDALAILGVNLNVSNAVLQEADGGTGATTFQGVRDNLGLGTIYSYNVNTSETTPVAGRVPLLNSVGRIPESMAPIPSIIDITTIKLQTTEGIIDWTDR